MATSYPTPTVKERWAWAFYDWANSAFITTVMVAFFPIFFRNYWASELPSEEVTLHLGTANALASLSVMLLAPFLGAIADRGGIKKPLMAAFVVLGVCATLLLTVIGQNQWQWAMFAFVLAVVGFLGANIFYDSLLVDVAEEKDFNRVSALGYGLGYLGGGILFSLCVLMSLHPEWFGLADSSSAVRWAFGITAVWWAGFSIPLWLLVHQKSGNSLLPRPALGRLLVEGWRDFVDTFRHIRQLKSVGLFLLAYWFYIDGVALVYDTGPVIYVGRPTNTIYPQDAIRHAHASGRDVVCVTDRFYTVGRRSSLYTGVVDIREFVPYARD